jgi:multiple sugar transport system permease protein
VLFGFPFYWLLSTSVKEQDELFRDPPVWVPAWPAHVGQSPYFARSGYAMPKPPAGVTASEWRAAWPTLREAAVRQMMDGYITRQGVAPPPPDSYECIARGVYQAIGARLSPEAARALIADPAAALQKVLEERDYKTVWDNVYRTFVIRGVTVQDQGFVQYKLKDEALAKQWQVASGDASLAPAKLGKQAAAQVSYRFDGGRSFVLETDLPSPMDPAAFRRLTIPFRGDRSWHRVDLEADIGGQLYRSTESLILFSNLPQEAAWQVPDADRTGASAFRDYLPLKSVGPGTTARDRVHVKLTVTRNSSLGAAFAKARRNYRDALNFVPMGTYFRNTLILVFLNVIGQILSCSVVAYAFARLKWPGRDISFAVVLSTMMLPAQVTMIPVFLIYRYLGWYDTLQPLWVGSFFGNAFFIFLLRQFMRTIPKDLEEAAKIDGCSFFGMYWKIIMPLIRPALAAVAIFSFMNAWNEFMGPLIYLNDQRLYPLSLGLYQFRIEHAADFGMLMAASALMIVPVVIVFFVAQRHFIQGVTLTGMKG